MLTGCGAETMETIDVAEITDESTDEDYGSMVNVGSYIEAEPMPGDTYKVSFDLRVAKLTAALWPAYEEKFVMGVASSLKIAASDIVITPKSRRRRLGGAGPSVMLLHVTVSLPSQDAADDVVGGLHTHGYTSGLKNRLQLMGVELFNGVDSNVITIDPATIQSGAVDGSDHKDTVAPIAPSDVPLSLEAEVQDIFEQAFYSRDAGLGLAGYRALGFVPPHDFSSRAYYMEVVQRVSLPLMVILLVLLFLQIVHRSQKPEGLYRFLFDKSYHSSTGFSNDGDVVLNNLYPKLEANREETMDAQPQLEPDYESTMASMTPMPNSALDSPARSQEIVGSDDPRSVSNKWHLFNGLCKMGADDDAGGSVRSPRTGISGQGHDAPFYMVINSQLTQPTAPNGVNGFAIVEGSRARIEGEVRAISVSSYRAEGGDAEMAEEMARSNSNASVLVFDFRIVEPCKEALVKPSGGAAKSILASWGGTRRRLATVSSNGALQCRDGLGSLTINRCPGVAYVGTVRDEYPDVNQDTHIEIRLNAKLSQKGMVVGIICYPGPIFHDGLTLLQGEIKEDALVFEEAEVLHTPTNTILVPVDYHLVLSRDAQTAAGSYQYAVDGERGQVAISLKNHSGGGINSAPKLLTRQKNSSGINSGASAADSAGGGAGCLDWLCCIGNVCGSATEVTPIAFDIAHNKPNVIRPGALYHLRRAGGDGVQITCSRRGLGSNPQEVLTGGRRRGGHSFWTAGSANSSADEEEQWVVLDLGEHTRLIPSHYTLQQVPAYNGEATTYPMNLEGLLIEGTNSWDPSLRTAFDDWHPVLEGNSELIEGSGKPGEISSWATDVGVANRAGGYRAFRVRLPTEYGSREGAVIALGGVEFYGKLLSSSSGTPAAPDGSLSGGSILGSEAGWDAGSIAPSSAPSSPQSNYNDDSRAPLYSEKWADATVDGADADGGCCYYYGVQWGGGFGTMLLRLLVVLSTITLALSLYSGYHGLQVVSGRSTDVEAAISHAGSHFSLLSEYGDQMAEASGALHDGLARLSTTCSDDVLSSRRFLAAGAKATTGTEAPAASEVSGLFQHPWNQFDKSVRAFNDLSHQLADVSQLAPLIGSYSSTSYVGAALPVATSSIQAVMGMMALNGYIHPHSRSVGLLYMASFSYFATFINAGGVLLQASSAEVVKDFCTAGEKTALYFVKTREVPPTQLAEVQNVANHIAQHELTASMTTVIKGLIEGQAQLAKNKAKEHRRRLQLGVGDDAVIAAEVESLAVRALREAVFSKYLTPSLPLTDFLTSVARCTMDSSESHELYNGKNSVQEQMSKATAALRDLGSQIEEAKASGCGGDDTKLIESLANQAKATASLAHAVTSGAQCKPLHALWVDVIDNDVCDTGLAAVKAQAVYAYAVMVLTILCAMLALAAHRNWVRDGMVSRSPSRSYRSSPTRSSPTRSARSGYDEGSEYDEGSPGALSHGKHHSAAPLPPGVMPLPATPAGPAPLAPLGIPAPQPWRPKVLVADKFFFEEKLVMDGFQVLKHSKSSFGGNSKDLNRVLYLENGNGSERWLVCARSKPDPKADKRFKLSDVSQAQAVPNHDNRFFLLGGGTNKRLLELEVPNRQARDGIVHHLNVMLSKNKQGAPAAKQPVYMTNAAAPSGSSYSGQPGGGSMI
jgi:hypothetical protein